MAQYEERAQPVRKKAPAGLHRHEGAVLGPGEQAAQPHIRAGVANQGPRHRRGDRSCPDKLGRLVFLVTAHVTAHVAGHVAAHVAAHVAHGAQERGVGHDQRHLDGNGVGGCLAGQPLDQNGGHDLATAARVACRLELLEHPKLLDAFRVVDAAVDGGKEVFPIGDGASRQRLGG